MILKILLLALLPFIITGLISNIVYWYEALNTPCADLPHPKPTIRECVSMYFRTVGGYLMAFLSHPVGRAMKPLSTKGIKPHTVDTPILFIHGIYHNAGAWVFLRFFLEQKGCYCSTFSYHSFAIKLHDIVQRFDAAVGELEQKHGKKPLIIAHSLGGIIARLWLLEQGNQDRIAGIVTLATPHGGSKFAALAHGALVRVLTPNSPVMQRLANTEVTPTVPCVSFCSCADEAVLPAHALLPPKGWKLVPIGTPSHVGMLFRHSVAKRLWAEIKPLVNGVH